ncbi:MAG: hypothetical protein LBQ81_13695 [Zoogloeaceae bacterium]|jgi:hypothetical protein|nr:hypothetical protein [Zoogloeaceae bacterium]
MNTRVPLFAALAVFGLPLSSPVFAGEALMEEGEDEATVCARIQKYNDIGAQYYRQKAYALAREAFINQAALADFCSINQSTTEHQMAIAYNNVALTYLRQQKYAWAFAWANLLPGDKNSRYNLEQIRPHLVTWPKKIAGTYVQYAGMGAWSVVTVRQNGKSYDIGGELLRMGINSLMYGPNMGDFGVSMPLNQRVAHYRPDNDSEADCEISVRFGDNRLELKTTGDAFDCGFGAGVHAGGTFLRVTD